MSKLVKQIIFILLPIPIFVLGLLAGYYVTQPSGHPFVAAHPKEIIIGIALLLFIRGISRLDWFASRSLMQKLRFLGFAVIGLFVLKKILSGIFRLESFDGNQDFTSFYLSYHFFTVVVLLCITVLTIWILFALKTLIFIQQKGKTNRNYKTLLFFIAIQIFLAAFLSDRGMTYSSDFSGFEGESVFNILVFSFVCFFAFINGFRCKWIHYLKKNQKAAIFFFGSIVYVFLVWQIVSPPRIIDNYSIVLATFYNSFLIFYVIYFGMALIGVLFHLPSAGLLDKRLDEIQSFQELSSAIGSVFELKALISKTAELSIKVVNADYSWIELKENDGFFPAGTHQISLESVEKIPEQVKQFIRKEIRESGDVVLINDLLRNSATKKIRKWSKKAGSLLASPIIFKDQLLGILYSMSAERYGFMEESRGLFKAFSNQVAVAIQNVNLIEVIVEQQVYKQELRVAHEAQMKILPQTMPCIPGFEVQGFCRTANEIGGDFYDVVKVNEDRIDIIIGDVSGKGALAAFCMAELKGVIQALAPHCHSPKQVLVEVNTFIRNNFDKGMFATMIYVILQPSKRKIHFVRAGHPPIALIRDHQVLWLEEKGLGLGLAPDTLFRKTLVEKTVKLKKEDTIVLYSDGVEEARNQSGEDFGEEAFTEQLRGLQTNGAKDIIDHIVQKLDEFMNGVSIHDDMTLVALSVSK